MLAEIILLRLDAVLRAMPEAGSVTKSRFVPICPGMVFKQIQAARAGGATTPPRFTRDATETCRILRCNFRLH